MKILLSAYSCLPGDGSEPGIGWNWAQCIATIGHDVVVITRGVNRQPIEEFVAGHSLTRLQFAFHDLSPMLQRMRSWPLGNYAYYFLWQYTAARQAVKLHQTERFDQVHHITWGSFRVPSFMGRLGIPFIFGPVGGGEETPRNLRRGLGWRGWFSDGVRRISSALMAPFMEFTYASASEIVATTEETRSKIQAKYRNKARLQQSVGIDQAGLLSLLSKLPQNPVPRNSSKLELLFVGRLLPWKGLHLILRALALLNGSNSDVHLTVIGSGHDLSRLQRLSRRLKVDEMISWIPWMPREKLFGMYSQFDLFTFPSLHDSGGMAVLEALAFGLPVLCLDLGGPGIAVNNNCGRVIPTAGASEKQVVEAIAQFLSEMLADRSKLRRLSQSARSRAASLNWQANVDSIYSGSFATQSN